MAIAHSANENGQRHDLVAHLRGTAALARTFAANLQAADLGYVIGLCHDVGKFHPAFQQYLLEGEAGRVARGHGPDHKAAGSLLTQRTQTPLLSLLIQGHHGGLRSPNDYRSWLMEKSGGAMPEEALAIARDVLPDLAALPRVDAPAFVLHDQSAAEMFLRLLFSALVDADFLDTEAHFDSNRSARRQLAADLPALLDRFERNQQAFLERRGRASGYAERVAAARATIYEDCLVAAGRPRGLFRLTVPTGGGKTRSAMAFALRHAVRHGMERVVVAVPFITVTEQIADVYRDALGSPADHDSVVLEHHSGTSADGEGDELLNGSALWSRLASENWDAPVVVTTTVQLFESLLGNRTSQVRKLHRLANTVIILDEAQAIPPHLLSPTLDALQQLVRHYGSTVVLSTATQPAFEAIPTFASIEATEIIKDPARWFEDLRRVRYDWRVDPPLGWAEIAGILRAERQALAVVNTKKDAFSLLDAIDDEAALHLSTALCGAHRRRVLEEIRRRIDAGETCRLVSTQVVEAGVDLDFPVVLRALGPLDSVVQAAGRCNREGRHGPEGGRVIVVRPANGGTPPGSYRTATMVTPAVLGSFSGGGDRPDRPEVLERYFRYLFRSVDTDRDRIQAARAEFDYPEVARRFRLIDDDTEAVLVETYGSVGERKQIAAWAAELGRGGHGRLLLRRLQPYLVSVRRDEAQRHRALGLMEEIAPGVSRWLGSYDPIRGLGGESVRLDALVV